LKLTDVDVQNHSLISPTGRVIDHPMQIAFFFSFILQSSFFFQIITKAINIYIEISLTLSTEFTMRHFVGKIYKEKIYKEKTPRLSIRIIAIIGIFIEDRPADHASQRHGACL